MINGKYFTAEQRGLLEDSLSTEKCITKFTFDCLVKSNLYSFYGYDERIKAKVYILYKHHLNLGLPAWLHVYDDTRRFGKGK